MGMKSQPETKTKPKAKKIETPKMQKLRIALRIWIWTRISENSSVFFGQNQNQAKMF